jgi:2-dehydro-3-deoxygalactonokinase
MSPAADGRAAALIGLDWGTSSFRAYRLAADGTILERRVAEAGILAVADGDFAGELTRQIGDWLVAAPDLPVLASGMIGSRQGWIEAPYVPCPAGADDLVTRLVEHRTAMGTRLWLVPGLSHEGSDGVPDVMRGEETQILGVGRAAAARLVVLPGTHSKWALVEDGRVVWFATFMTGELFAVLRRHSILGRLMAGDGEDPAAFARGLRAGLSGDRAQGGLLHRLFAVRTLGLFDRIAATGLADYLSGLLIGEEVREALGCVGHRATAEVVIVGGAGLAGRYQEALRQAGLAALPFQGEAAALGQLAIARAAGLVR